MFNYYEIEISGKYVKNLFSNIISNKISMYDIKYNSNKISFKVTYENYLKIKTIKTTCNVSINKTYGKNKLVLLFNKYKVFFISFALSLIIIYLFSHMAFFIKINNNNKEINEILKQEMISNNLTIYSFKKPYKKLKNISNKIKDNNKDLFEWLEISTNGVYYEVDYIERKSVKEDINNIKHNIIASKNGLIKKLDITKGSIVKNVGDYVSKNDLIVTGIITKNDEIKNIVDAKGKVYAEVWYKVKVSHPFIKKEYEKTNKSKTTLSLTIFGKEIKIFSFKKNAIKKEKNIYLINNNLFNIKINKSFIYKEKINKYTKEELINIANNLAKKKIEESLEKDEEILLQKTLKIEEDNDKIYVEVFFKVYEDIAELQEIKP